MEADVMRAFSDLVKAGFPPRMAAEMLHQGGRIPEDADLDEIEMEWLMGQQMNDQIPPPETEDDETEE